MYTFTLKNMFLSIAQPYVIESRVTNDLKFYFFDGEDEDCTSTDIVCSVEGGFIGTLYFFKWK